MRTLVRNSLLVLGVVVGLGACGTQKEDSQVKLFGQSENAPLETVASVDVARYLGKWFEIARLPQIFQPGCTAVTAEYSLNDDGSVKVFNSCRILNPENGQITITGRATLW